MCVFSSHSFWTSNSLDVPAGVTQEEGHTGFFIHLPSAVRALIFFARRIQPFLSLVDREVEFCVLTIKSFSKNPVCRDRTHVPTCQKVTRIPLSYRGPALATPYYFEKIPTNDTGVLRTESKETPYYFEEDSKERYRCSPNRVKRNTFLIFL